MPKRESLETDKEQEVETQDVEFDCEKSEQAVTTTSNDLESKKPSSGSPETETNLPSRSKRSRKIPSRYLNYDLD